MTMNDQERQEIAALFKRAQDGFAQTLAHAAVFFCPNELDWLDRQLVALAADALQRIARLQGSREIH